MFRQAIEQIARSLENNGIPYMIIGGQAVLLYGEPRLTRDIDITLGVGPENYKKLVDIVTNLGWELLTDDPAEFVRETLILPCEVKDANIRVDFIFSASEYERQALNRVHRVPYGDVSVSFISVEDLIIHKMISARPRDIDDVRLILGKNQQIDNEYILKWLRRFEDALARSLVVEYRKLLGAVSNFNAE